MRSRLGAQVVGDAAQPVAGFQGHERLLGGLGQADPAAPGEAVVERDDEAQLLFVEAAGHQVGGGRHRRGQAQVEFAAAQPSSMASP